MSQYFDDVINFLIQGCPEIDFLKFPILQIFMQKLMVNILIFQIFKPNELEIGKIKWYFQMIYT